MPVPSIVIDANVIVSAIRSRLGASYRLLNLIDSGKYQASISVALALEYESVVKRLVGQVPLTLEELDDILSYVYANANKCHVSYLWRPFLKDPKDDMVLELAIAASSDYIVTYNRRDFRGAKRFGIGVCTPRELLAEIGELS
jgi:putative PIN family toxin of toxin-antitoxin system